MSDKWYHSEIGFGVMTSSIFFSVALGIGGCNYLQSRGEAEIEKAKTLVNAVQYKYINNNSIPERYIVLEGRKYFVEIDGKSVEDTLK